MVLVLDTSSARTAVALVEDGEPRGELVVDSGRTLRLPELVAQLVDVHGLSAVAVATGPGSFTGLRAGASYAVGLALGLGIDLLGLPTLELAAARAYEPARGLAEAGRGRVYHQAPGGEPGLAEPEELPRDLPAAGWLRNATAESVRRAGVRLLSEAELRSFGEAAAGLLEGAQKLGYDTVRLRYMQSFGPLT